MYLSIQNCIVEKFFLPWARVFFAPGCFRIRRLFGLVSGASSAGRKSSAGRRGGAGHPAGNMACFVYLNNQSQHPKKQKKPTQKRIDTYKKV